MKSRWAYRAGATPRRVCLAWALGVSLLLMGCGSAGPTRSRQNDVSNWRELEASRPQFSAKTVRNHLLAINQLGPRISGSVGSDRVRQYLRRSLHKFEIGTREQRVSVAVTAGKIVELRHLTAEIPGRSRDVLLLAAHYDTSPEVPSAPSRNDSRASGAALLLELARVLALGTTPTYTLWLTWIDGDALQAPTGGGRFQVRPGSQSLLDAWKREQKFSQLRAAIFFGNIVDRDQPFIRDVDSPRIYREIFWEAARDLGYSASFPPGSRYESLNSCRETFARASLRSSIAMANQANLYVEAGRRAETSPQPHRSSTGYEAIGNVTLEAVARISSRLHKIDQFAGSRLTAGRDVDVPLRSACVRSENCVGMIPEVTEVARDLAN